MKDLSGDGRLLTDVIGIGVLTKVFDRDLLDTILGESGRQEQRKRLLPARVVMYFVLAMTLYASEAYEEVARRLVHGLTKLAGWRGEWKVPSDSAISQARTRLGYEPFEALFQRAAVPLARPMSPNAFFARLRVTAVDGVVLDVPDSASNAEAFGYSGRENTNRSAFPQVRVVTLSEVGTHATIGAALGPYATGERALATEVFNTYLDDTMLLVADRGFYSYELFTRAADIGAHLLWRVKDDLTLPVRTWLPDGSYLSEILPSKIRAAITRTGRTELGDGHRRAVRVIEYMIEGRGQDMTTIRLVSTLLDPHQAPAAPLAAVYAERWEHELIFDEIETHQMHPSKVLRSRTASLVRQEIWAYLLTHYAVRAFIAGAADDIGDDPDRLSFIRAIRLIRRSVDDQAGFSPL